MFLPFYGENSLIINGNFSYLPSVTLASFYLLNILQSGFTVFLVLSLSNDDGYFSREVKLVLENNVFLFKPF